MNEKPFTPFPTQPFPAAPFSNVPAPMWPSTNVAASPNEQAPKPLPIDLLNELRDANVTQDIDGLLVLWNRSQATLAEAKENEMRLRKLCIEHNIQQPVEGVNNVDLGGGYALKATINYDYAVRVPDGKRDKIQAVDECIEEMRRADNEGAFIAQRLFKYDVDISVTEYRKLCEEAKLSPTKAACLKALNKVLEIKPKAPKLEIKEPKGKRK